MIPPRSVRIRDHREHRPISAHSIKNQQVALVREQLTRARRQLAARNGAQPTGGGSPSLRPLEFGGPSKFIIGRAMLSDVGNVSNVGVVEFVKLPE